MLLKSDYLDFFPLCFEVGSYFSSTTATLSVMRDNDVPGIVKEAPSLSIGVSATPMSSLI